jgi:integrase
MPAEYRIGRLNGVFQLVFNDASGARRRYSLGTTDAGEGRRLAPSLYAELTRPKGTSVGELWEAYTKEYAGRAIVETMEHTRKAIESRFWKMSGDAITVADCRAHTEERRAAGIKDWTIYTELGHVRNVLGFAVKHNLLAKASYIERPAQPKPKEDKHLTRDQVRRLFDSSGYPHVALSAVLLYTTAARSAALRGLKWVRCDFDRKRIDLRDPDITRQHKGRAIVPMLRTAESALLKAREGALTEYVIEWAGKPVGSLKRGLRTAARVAGIAKAVSPHVLRHSAAVHMAEDGVAMDEIAQFLGHSDVNTTRKIYARFSPDYLRQAASALEFDDMAG